MRDKGFTAICTAVLITAAALTACGKADTQVSRVSQAVPSAETSKEAVTKAPMQPPTGAGDAETGSSEVTFTDDLGREISVTAPPERVAALIGSYADIWRLAGGLEQIVAAPNDSWTEFEIPFEEDVINLGSSKKVSLEPVLAAEPDFILASSNTEANLALLEPLEEMRIPAAYFQVSTFEEYLHMLEVCTQITGYSENYNVYGAAVEEQVNAARESAAAALKTRIDPPTVLYIRVSSNGCVVKNSENSVLGEMLSDLGAVNIADSETSLLESLSLEKIMAIDPEYIFVVLQAADVAEAEAVLEETLLSNPAWASLMAVKNNNYHIMDQRMYNLKPNEKWGEAYQELEEILYSAE